MLVYTLNMIAPTDMVFINRDELYVANRLHSHEFVELEYILSGTGVQIINRKEYEVRRGDIIYIGLNDKHAYYSTNKIRVINLIIHPALHDLVKKTLNNIFIDKSCQLPNFIRLSSRKFIEVEEKIFMIEKEFEQKKEGYRQILNNLITVLFIDIYRKTLNSQENDNGYEARKALTEYVNEHYTTLKLADIAAAFNYSPSYFSKYFKKTMGITLAEYIMKKKINDALRLLISTEQPIDEIIRSLGYSDKKNFYDIFKRYTGSTPNKIRKSAVSQEDYAAREQE